jgi:hypothetical protein
VSATAETVLEAHRNGSPIGTITFGTGASAGSFATAGGGAETFAAADRLAIINEDRRMPRSPISRSPFWARGPDHGLGFRYSGHPAHRHHEEQFFDQVPTLNRGRRRTCRCRSIFRAPRTDHAIVAVYTTLDDASEVWDLIPMMEFLIENTTDPNRISFLVTGVYKFRVGVRRSGSTDTITSADLSLGKVGVNA